MRIGNFVMRSFGARPWRFSAEDYNPVSGRALNGTLVNAGWDARLAPKMAQRGYVLEEEAVVHLLLADLSA